MFTGPAAARQARQAKKARIFPKTTLIPGISEKGKKMKINRKNFFNNIDFTAYCENNEISDNTVIVVDENGWIDIDITTACKNMKTAVNRMFSVFTDEEIKYYELDGWQACLLESIESNYFSGGRYDCMKTGENPNNYYYSWEIEWIDDDRVYLFVNVNYGAFKA